MFSGTAVNSTRRLLASANLHAALLQPPGFLRRGLLGALGGTRLNSGLTKKSCSYESFFTEKARSLEIKTSESQKNRRWLVRFGLRLGGFYRQ